MKKNFIWQFQFELQKQPCWQAMIASENDDNIGEISDARFEQRFFWADDEIIMINGFSLSELWLSQYLFETNHDNYLLSGNDCNLKFRKKKLHLKPLVQETDGIAQFAAKEKYHLVKDLPAISKILNNPNLLSIQKDIETIKLALKKYYPVIEIYKERFQLPIKQLNASIEFSRLSLNNKIFHSVVIESDKAHRIIELRKAMALPLANSKTYAVFLKELEC